MKFHVIIPARYHSTRLPRKPLLEIGGRTMIEHVCHRAKESGAQTITVATDHSEILECVKNAGFNAVLTDPNHVSGSDRIYQAAQILGLSDNEIIVNVQGDEPFIPSENISLVASLINKHQTKMATLCSPILEQDEIDNPNAVKVIFDCNKKAIYFSRAAIPFDRDSNKNNLAENYFRHIGLYAYTKSFLSQYVLWPESSLEKMEKLEQLRVIENGESIHLEVLEASPPAGIDTQEDLERAIHFFSQLKSPS